MHWDKRTCYKHFNLVCTPFFKLNKISGQPDIKLKKNTAYLVTLCLSFPIAARFRWSRGIITFIQKCGRGERACPLPSLNDTPTSQSRAQPWQGPIVVVLLSWFVKNTNCWPHILLLWRAGNHIKCNWSWEQWTVENVFLELSHSVTGCPR